MWGGWRGGGNFFRLLSLLRRGRLREGDDNRWDTMGRHPGCGMCVEVQDNMRGWWMKGVLPGIEYNRMAKMIPPRPTRKKWSIMQMPTNQVVRLMFCKLNRTDKVRSGGDTDFQSGRRLMVQNNPGAGCGRRFLNRPTVFYPPGGRGDTQRLIMHRPDFSFHPFPVRKPGVMLALARGQQSPTLTNLLIQQFPELHLNRKILPKWVQQVAR